MRDSKKEKLMHSVSVYPCLSETVCAQTLCMWLPSFDMLSCPDLQMTTASSSSWGSSPTSFFNSKYLFCIHTYQGKRCRGTEVTRLDAANYNPLTHACGHKHIKSKPVPICRSSEAVFSCCILPNLHNPM